MDDSVRNMENGIREVQEEAVLEGFLQKASEQSEHLPDAEQKPMENVMKKGPGLKESAAGKTLEEKQDQAAQKINPALKYGRRMDYKTAKVNDKQTKDLNLSLSSPAPSVSSKHSKEQEEPKSALELELEALEAAAGKSPQPIHNPLPTPKKRVPKEMEFDIEPPDYAMHFDLVDLHGKDFFDIN